jgi:uncharacterized LabA/DUF88 family protein
MSQNGTKWDILAMSEFPKPRRVIAFVDGYNLYYGLLKDNPDFKWLDIIKLIKMLFPHDEIVSVKYFTAAVDADEKYPTPRRERQIAYWDALENSGVKIIKGRLEYRRKLCAVSQCTFTGDRTHYLPVEKMTDVNLALHITIDTRRLGPDVVCVISGDTDIIPALDYVRANFKCRRHIFIPCSEETLKERRVDQFDMLSWETKRLKEEVVTNCRFDETIHVGGRADIICPLGWRRAPWSG